MSSTRRSSSRKKDPTPTAPVVEDTNNTTTEEEFVLVDGVPTPKPIVTDDVRVKGTPEEEAAYEQHLDTAWKADLLGIELPPVAPPGHHLQPIVEKQKETFWKLLFKRAENRSALYQLYVATILMVTVPLSMMGITYFTIFSGMTEENRLTYSGFAGVLGVNIIAIGFGLFAYYDNGGDDAEAEAEADELDAAELKRQRWEEWERKQEEEETIENRERLQQLRQLHEEKKEGASTTEDVSDGPKKRGSSAARTSSRKKVAHDSALTEENDSSNTAATDETTSTPSSRTTRARSRSQKAD